MEPNRNINIPQTFEANIKSVESPHEVGSFALETNINKIDKNEAKREVVDIANKILEASNPSMPLSQENIITPNPVQTASSPSVAKDIDLMEDAWVKDLKKMIEETKGDPYAREVRFKEMQIDYLKKRYNRIINGGR